jgi:hypothetical protein
MCISFLFLEYSFLDQVFPFHYTNAHLLPLLSHSSFILMSIYFFLISPALPRINHRFHSSLHISDNKHTTKKEMEDLQLFLQLQLSILRVDIQIKWEHYQKYILYHNYTNAPIFYYIGQYIFTITKNIYCSFRHIAQSYQLVYICTYIADLHL